MVMVTCLCGRVELGFPASNVPRVRSLCGCDDCQRRIQYLAQKGGTPLDLEHPIEVANFENQIRFVSHTHKGQQQQQQQQTSRLQLLEVFQLGSETHMRNVASTCCHSFLCAQNTDFHGNAVATLPQYAEVTHAATHKDIEFLSFGKFWPNKKYQPPVDTIQFWKTEDGGFDGTKGFMDALDTAMRSNAAPLSEKIPGTLSFDELVEGLPVQIV